MVDYARMGKFCTKNTKTDRFLSFKERECKSDLTCVTFKSLSYGKYHNTWKNVPLMKDPLSLSMYQNLFQEIQFKTIFELGAYEGASALWMHDIMSILNNKCKIYSYDIDLSLVQNECFVENIEYVQMDVNNIENEISRSFLASCPKPWLIIEDCHVNVVNSMSYFATYANQGDYIIIEDTNPLGPSSPEVIANDDMYKVFGTKKYDQASEFCSRFPQFKVDTKYCDMYGYNSTWQWNSVLRYV